MSIFMFNEVVNVSDEYLTNLLGGKGANLNKMTNELLLPVPEGFTIPTTYSIEHRGLDKLTTSLQQELVEYVVKLNTLTKRKLGDLKKPLLVSVRSGAPRSMPGMMETILNLGINDETVKGLAKQTNERFAYDSYRRFIQMYAVTALGLPSEPFNEVVDAAKAFCGNDLDLETINLIIRRFRAILKKFKVEVPQDVTEQLHGAVLAVFKSWDAPKAKTYRKIEGISDDIGTAVNVQRMVFGNMNTNSGTGVAFTRNPNTGENVRFGDFLVNAQGEDVVDGSSITLPLSAMDSVFPDQAKELERYMAMLEGKFQDMCDIEFTIEDGKLFMLQTRIGKRNPAAAARIAVEMLLEGIIDKDTSLARIAEIKSTTTATNNDVFNGALAGTGLGACPGIVVGQAVFDPGVAEAFAEKGTEVILIRQETSPNDVGGMAVSKGILTATGGLVSHAAVVARGWNKPCVVGCEGLKVFEDHATLGSFKIKQGDEVCIDGTSGEVFLK